MNILCRVHLSSDWVERQSALSLSTASSVLWVDPEASLAGIFSKVSCGLVCMMNFQAGYDDVSKTNI